ncbi:MAG: hypothetical protein IJ219_03540 [Bacteroidaceae bacterium]|nr:hypothetical protein [Bacteroidaceae bacterium]
MDSELQKSSIFGLLQETGVQHAEGRVRSKSLMEEMSLIGFIPYTDNYLLQKDIGMGIDLNGHLYVAPNLVKFSKDTPIYPYFKKIVKANGKKYNLNENLYLDPILDKAPLYEFNHKEIRMPYDSAQLLKLLKYKTKLLRVLKEKGVLIEEEKDKYDYIAGEGEIELSHGLGNMIAISCNFLCLCSYINKVKGTPCYVVLTSDDTIRVQPEDEDE